LPAKIDTALGATPLVDIDPLFPLNKPPKRENTKRAFLHYLMY